MSSVKVRRSTGLLPLIDRSPREREAALMTQASSPDLNYLLFRQQVERSRAAAATSDSVREAHLQLARSYEQQIDSLTANSFAIAGPQRVESEWQRHPIRPAMHPERPR